MRKIAIIGAGKVGSTICYSVSERKLADRIVIVNPNVEKARAVSFDVGDSGAFDEGPIVESGTYDDIADADAVVVAAGTSPKDATGNRRTSGMAACYEIVKDIAAHLRKLRYSKPILIATNPLDVMTYALRKEMEGVDDRIYGTGTALDTARYVTILARKLHVRRQDVSGFVYGEHGESAFCAFDTTTVKGKRLLEYMKENGIAEDVLASVQEGMVTGGTNIAIALGYTCHGIASVASVILEALLSKKERILPISRYKVVDGVGPVCISTLARICDGTVEERPMHLSPREEKSFVSSAKVIRSNIEKLGMK